MKPRPETDPRDMQRALALVRMARDPALPGLVLAAVAAMAGFVAIVLAYYGSARTIYVFLQLPEIISGGLGGLALIGLGAALFDIQMDRRDAAEERRVTDEMLGEVAELIALAPRYRAALQAKSAPKRRSARGSARRNHPGGLARGDEPRSA